MSTAFSSRITQLRKERGLSQKEVALSLGVSQALLSHYEKGVRECGLDFVVRCADYFGVTTDFLLGRQTSKYGLRFNFEDPATLATVNDKDRIDIQTVLLCGSYLAERFSVIDENFGDKLLWAYAISQYKLIVAGVSSGRFRPDWLEHRCRNDDVLFQQVVDGIYRSLLLNTRSVSPMTSTGNIKFPPFIDRLVVDVEDYVDNVTKNYLVKKLK